MADYKNRGLRRVLLRSGRAGMILGYLLVGIRAKASYAAANDAHSSGVMSQRGSNYVISTYHFEKKAGDYLVT